MTAFARRGWLKPREVASYWRLNVKTIYRRIRSGDLPAIRLPDGQIRISADDAMTYGRRIAVTARRQSGAIEDSQGHPGTG